MRKSLWAFLIALFLLSFTSQAQVRIDNPLDTIRTCPGAQISLSASGGASYTWTSSNSIFSINRVVSIFAAQGWIYVSGTNGNIITKDSIFILPTNTTIVIMPETNPYLVCRPGDEITMSARGLPLGGTYNWNIAGNGANTTAASQIYRFNTNTTLIVNYETGGCRRSDTAFVRFKDPIMPTFIATDTLICPGARISVSNAINTTTTRYSWSPIAGINVANTSNPIFSPTKTTVYTLTVTAFDGTCPATASITVRVKDVSISISGRDSLEVCKPPGTATLTAVTRGAGGIITWYPNMGTLSDSTARIVTVTPKANRWYFVKYDIQGCIMSDSIFVRLDSIQEFGLNAILSKEKYCPGEIVALVSNPIDRSRYPDIQFDWLNKDESFIREEEFGNLVIITTSPRWYIRKNTNHGCISYDSIYINVIIPNLNPSLRDTAVCRGAMFNITLQNPNLTDIKWSVEGTGTVSPDDKPTTKVTAGSSSFIVKVEAKDQGCPTTLSFQVTVKPPFPIALNRRDTALCKETSFNISVVSPLNLRNIEWSTSGGGSVSPANLMQTTLTTINNDLSFNVFIKANDTLGCPGEGGFTVSPLPKFNIPINGGNRILCSDGSFALSITDNTLNNIKWSLVGSGASLSTINGSQTTITTTGRTGFEIVVTADNAQGCPGEGRISISFTPKYAIGLNVRDTSICPSGALNISVVDNSSMLVWSTSSGTLSNTISKNAILTLSGNNPATVTVKGKNAQGCDGESMIVVSAANDVLNLTKVSPATCVGPNMVDAIISVVDASIIKPGTPVIWMVDGITVPNITTVSARLTVWKRKQTKSTVKAQVTSTKGCPLEATIDICYLQPIPPDVPNAFSPNGDQKNDSYGIKANDAEINDMKIYNRWGQIVFDSVESNSFTWDGKFGGQDAPVEVYILRLQYTDFQGLSHTIRKDITLIR